MRPSGEALQTMRSRLASGGVVLGLITYLLIALVLPLFIRGGTAYASGEQYIFYYNASDVPAIKQAFTPNPLPTALSSAFDDTAVYGKGGLLGSQPYAFVYDDSSSFGAIPTPGHNGAINVTYNSNVPIDCAVTQAQPGIPDALLAPSQAHPYHVSIPLTLTVTLTQADIISQETNGHDIVSGVLSADPSSITVTSQGSIALNEFGDPGTPVALNDVLNNDINSNNPASIASVVPQSCLPDGLKLANGTIESTGPVQLLNYVAMIPSAQHAWPGLQTSGAITTANNGANNPSSGAGVGAANTQIGCEFQLTNPLSWLVCSAVYLFGQFINAYDSAITNQLNVKTNAIFCDTTDTCKAYYSAWQSFRDIALGLVTLVGLAIVISQALGLEILDAYTIRRVLPRLLIAIIGIALSWPLMKFLVQLSDDLGFGIRHLIYAPFAHLSDTGNLDFGNSIANFFFGGGVVLEGGIAAWIQFGGLGALILFALTAALAVAVAIATLILRQVAIILMMLLAPIAIIAYVLPNTQRTYKLWWESFSKALLMFPLIAALIATGRVFSAITFNNGGFFNQLIGFIAYFAPYFMIPATFRFAGSALSGMSGFINNRAQGGFAALAKQRSENRARRHTQARGRGLYRDAINIKNPFTGKKHNIAPFLNRVGLQTHDAQDYWRERMGTNKWQKQGGIKGAIGKTGGVFFGRQGRDLASRRANQRIEHTRKLGEENPLRYHGSRGISGDYQYMFGALAGQRVRNGEFAGQDAQQVMLDHFAERDKHGNLLYYDDATGTTRADPTKDPHKDYNDLVFKPPKGEGEILQLANVLDSAGTDTVNGKGAREAATDLRAYAIGLDTHQAREDVHRGDTEFLGKMQAAAAGRLENHEIARYYNKLARGGTMTPGEAKKRLKTLQQLAAQKRPSQAEGYGLAFRTEMVDGQPVEIAYDVYQDPAGAESQESIGRISSDDIRPAKSEDFVPDKTNPDQLSGYGEAWVAAMSNVEMESYHDNGQYKVRPKIVNGRQVAKSAAGQRNAASARAKFETIDLYGSGDVGMQGAAMLIMGRAGVTIRPRTGGDIGSGSSGGGPSGGSTTGGGSVTYTRGSDQARWFPPQQPPPPPPPSPLGGPGGLPPPPTPLGG